MTRQAATIPRAAHIGLLESLNAGSSIAEDDNLLYEARVETSVFDDLAADRIDIVRGTKGSGKSAIYRLLTLNSDELFRTGSLVLVKGVENTGDPVFKAFSNQFAQLDEAGFQNFWRVYFITLILTTFIGDAERYGTRLGLARAELSAFRKVAKAQGFPVLEKKWSLQSIVGWVLGRLKSVRVSAKTPDGTETALEMTPDRSAEHPEGPIFVAQVQEALAKLLERAEVNLWIMLDRLDEVFPRRSNVETTALRALLRTTLSFRDPRLRTKLFLRDDIFSTVTEASGGFPALTHVLARSSDILSWSRDQILQLIVNRIFAAPRLQAYYKIDKSSLSSDAKYREAAFYRIFPERMKRGPNQSKTLDWIYKHSADANGVVAPRDIINLINLARGEQLNLFRAQPTDELTLLGSPALLYGYQRMSQEKKVSYLDAEFEHFRQHIARFENQKAEHKDTCMARMFGTGWQDVARDLRSIGFLSFNAAKRLYSVPFLYRNGLGIRQGRCAGTCT